MKTTAIHRNPGRSIALAAGILFGILLCPAVAREETPRVIRYSFTVQNTTDQLREDVDFWTYAPVRETAHQKLVTLEASHPYHLEADPLGNQVLHFSLDRLTPYGSTIVSVQAELAMSDSPGNVPGPLPRYLTAERLVECGDPALQSTARRLAPDGVPPDPQRLFQFVRGHIRGERYRAKDEGALFAFRNQAGDCTEYACLFAALCRSRMIPARVLGGYVLDRNAVLKPARYHNWTEFKIDGAWYLADPQENVFKERESSYIAMRVFGNDAGPMRDFPRFRLEGGDGLKVSMNR